MVILFGAPQAGPDDALRALACAVAMQHALADFNQAEGRDLEMGIGINTGSVIAGNIGSEQRMKYGVVGSAINLAARVEGFTLGGQVLASSSAVDAAGRGDLVMGEAQSFKAKGRREPLVCYPIEGVGGRFGVALPEPLPDERRPVDLAVRIWPIEGKTVAANPLDGRATSLGRRTLWLRCATLDAQHRANLRLSIQVGEEWIDEIYAKVVGGQDDPSAEPLIEARFTSVPEGAAHRLAKA